MRVRLDILTEETTDTVRTIATNAQERKYFDSGDYAMSKAGVSPPQSVGTAIPSPANIPHAKPDSQSIPGAKSGSPTSGGGMSGSPGDDGGVGVGTSPPKQGGFSSGSPSKEPISQMKPNH